MLNLKKAKSSSLTIIGSGLAGYTLVREIRKLDKTFPITVITADNGDYYSKPQLSNALTHQKLPSQLALFTAEKFARQFDIKIIPNTQIDDLCHPECNEGSIVLACGASPIFLNKNAYQINNLEDYKIFREAIKNQQKITIVGAGLVGCEFANDLLNSDYDVTIIAPESYPLSKLVPEAIGQGLKVALENKGLKWRLGEFFNPDEDHGIVLSAIGLKPNTGLPEKAGIQINRGIVVDECLETSQEGVYALGDCAEVYGQVLPYIQPLSLCARALAHTLLGTPTPVIYPHMPIYIKTPTYPIVTIPPVEEGKWTVEAHADGIAATCYTQGRAIGFCLSGTETAKINDFLAKFG